MGSVGFSRKSINYGVDHSSVSNFLYFFCRFTVNAVKLSSGCMRNPIFKLQCPKMPTPYFGQVKSIGKQRFLIGKFQTCYLLIDITLRKFWSLCLWMSWFGLYFIFNGLGGNWVSKKKEGKQETIPKWLKAAKKLAGQSDLLQMCIVKPRLILALPDWLELLKLSI